MRHEKLKGIVTALVTPLTAAGELDEESLGQLIDTQLSAGIHALFILGSVGEGPMMPDRLYQRAIPLAGQFLGGRIPLLCGASDNSVARCLDRLHLAAEAGARYGVLTLPYYGWTGRPADGLRFFREAAERSPLPIVAYNLPKNIHWDMTEDFIRELFQIPNIAGLKDTRNEAAAMESIAANPNRPKHFFYMPGNSALGARLFAAGADGLVSTPSNVYPRLFVKLWNACQAQQKEEAARLSEVIRTLCGILTLPTGPAGIKCALELRGVCRRHTLSPWPQAGREEEGKIRQILDRVEVELAGAVA
jgi:dihydrodipicolinate synthase/N-acetylneuraminate lyase